MKSYKARFGSGIMEICQAKKRVYATARLPASTVGSDLPYCGKPFPANIQCPGVRRLMVSRITATHPLGNDGVSALLGLSGVERLLVVFLAATTLRTARLPVLALTLYGGEESGLLVCSNAILGHYPGLPVIQALSHEGEQAGHIVAVGTTIAGRPPHRSVQARLRIRLLPWMGSGEACIRVGMQNAGLGNPPGQQRRETIPPHLCPLTATD